jgi:acetyl esterase/lipase
MYLPPRKPVVLISRRVARRCGLLMVLLAATGGFAQQEIPLWADGAPGLKHEQPETVEDRRETGRMDRWISFVSNPTLTIFRPEGVAVSDAAVLVIPGGGFRYVCFDKEGVEVARWLNSIGVTAAVFKYRLLAPTAERTPKTIEPLFNDTERAMRVLRHHAAELKLNPKRIGVMGFSAGGTMAIRLLAEADAGAAEAADPVERLSSQPDFVALIYSGMPPGKPAPVTKGGPPVFLAHAVDDPKAPIAVATKIFQHLLEGGASVEFHAFRSGDHGFGVMPKAGTVQGWTVSYASWMRDLGLIAGATDAR